MPDLNPREAADYIEAYEDRAGARLTRTSGPWGRALWTLIDHARATPGDDRGRELAGIADTLSTISLDPVDQGPAINALANQLKARALAYPDATAIIRDAVIKAVDASLNLPSGTVSGAAISAADRLGLIDETRSGLAATAETGGAKDVEVIEAVLRRVSTVPASELGRWYFEDDEETFYTEGDLARDLARRVAAATGRDGDGAS